MIQFYWICIFLSGCYLTNAQSIHADKLVEEEAYKEAALAYERMFFNATKSSEKQHALIQKASCYKQLGDYEKALKALNRIRRIKNDSVKYYVNQQKLLLNYMNQEFQGARLALLKLKNSEKPDTLVTVIDFFTQLELLTWDEARLNLNANHAQMGLSKESIAYILPKKLRPKSPDKADNLSLLPGLGQWYAGYFWKGVLSGAIQTGLTGFSVYSLYKGYFFTGALTGVAGFYTFYLGGARYARNLAIQKNEETISEIKDRFYEKSTIGSLE